MRQVDDIAQDALRTRSRGGVGIQTIHHLREITFEKVCVRVQGDGRVAMAELLLDCFHIRTCCSHQRGACMPQVVRCDRSEILVGLFASTIPDGSSHVRVPEWPSAWRRKHQSLGSVFDVAQPAESSLGPPPVETTVDDDTTWREVDVTDAVVDEVRSVTWPFAVRAPAIKATQIAIPHSGPTRVVSSYHSASLKSLHHLRRQCRWTQGSGRHASHRLTRRSSRRTLVGLILTHIEARQSTS